MSECQLRELVWKDGGPDRDGVQRALAQKAQVQRLRLLIAAQARIIRDQARALEHGRKVFERASAAARIGVWECELADEKLTWTDGVYDIFGVPRGTPVDRSTILACYEPASAAELQRLRARAIAEGSAFSLDAEITTTEGVRRWIRITATVECEGGVAVRIFGMKQDITEEKLLTDRMRYLAECDVMTGLSNRQRFQSSLDALQHDRRPIDALLLIDLDGFKKVNDTFGHAVGDACLTELARRLTKVAAGLACFRIGGDEFAVFCAAADAETLAGRIVGELGLPVSEAGRTLLLGASVGVGLVSANCTGPGCHEPGFTTRACTGMDLFNRADSALYAAKAAGRNGFRVFVPAEPDGLPTA